MIKHTKVSSVSDGADTSQVQPSDWNADHEIDDAGAVRTALGLGSAALSSTSAFDAAGAASTAQTAAEAYADAAVAAGGSRPTFPTISNLQLRLSAEYSTITAVTDLVSAITDISGNGRNGASGSSAGKPRYFRNRFNGRYPGLWFDGSNNDHITCTLPNIAAPLTIVMVVEELAVGTSDGNIYRDQTARGVGYLASGNSWSIFGSGGSPLTSTTLYTQNRDRAPTNGPTALPCIRIDLYNGASSLIANNGVEATGTITNSGTLFGGTFHIGNGATAVASAAKFLLYEFLVFDKELIPTERGQLNTYYSQAVDIGI